MLKVTRLQGHKITRVGGWSGIVFIAVAYIFLCQGMLFARDISFELSVERNKVSLGQGMQLNLTFNGTQNMPTLELPAIDGFESRYVGPSTSMSVVNGQVSSSVTHVYTLVPLKTGVFNIGPLKFDYNGDTYASNAATVEVVEGEVAQNTPAESGSRPSAQDLSDRVFLVVQAAKNKLYLNEPVPLTIKLYINRLAVRDIQYPEFNHEGFSAGQFGQPRQYQESVGGVNYEVLEFDTDIFGLRPGEFRLGPAHLKCNLIVRKEDRRRAASGFNDFFDSNIFDDFFGRYETYPLDLKSADIPLTVSELPQENKPQDFSGAVGDFAVEASAGPAQVRVGDPVTLKVTVRGEGNFSTVNILEIASDKDFKIYEPQIKQENGQKTFEQILMPLNDAVREIPAVAFSFFNPRTGAYQSIVRGPFPLKVSKLEKPEESKIVEPKPLIRAVLKEEKLGRDIIYIKARPGPLTPGGGYLYRNRLFQAFHFLQLLVFLAMAVILAQSRRLKQDVQYARQLQAPRKAREGIRRAKNYLHHGDVKEFYDAVFQTLQEYLGDKFQLPSQGITISIVDELLKQKAIQQEALDKLRDIFRDCDMARYAASQFGPQDLEGTLKKLEEVIDYLQRAKL